MSLNIKNKTQFLVILLFFSFLFSSVSFAQVTLPTLNMGFKTTESPTEVVNAIKMVIVLTVLTLAPAILIMMTGFTRILIVLSFLRQALGVQQMPPNQLLVGLSLFLTFFVMGPAFTEINQKALQPYISGQMGQDQALENTLTPFLSHWLSEIFIHFK